MKAEATVVVRFRAKTMQEAGALLDDVLQRANERDDVDVARVELSTPPGEGVVTLPPVTSVAGRSAPSANGDS
jgi:hypothetical protein